MIDEADDWLFDSIALYQNLYMYDLQHGITAMDWIDDKNVCIATSSGSKHELAELHLPDKLLKASQEKAGLIKNRDFHMNAGCYCPHRVACLKHVPNSRTIATCPDTEACKIQFWKLGTDDTDVIRNISTVENTHSKGSPAHITPVPGTENLVFGSHLDNLCTVDSNTGQVSCTGCQRSERISSMDFTDSNTLICCCQETGELVTFDLREDLTKVKQEHTNNISLDQKCFWTSTVTEFGVLKLSSTGEVRRVEKHNWSTDVGRWNTELNLLSDFSNLTINALPRNEDTVYISGFDSNVYIFNLPMLSSMGSQTDHQVSKPVFKHEGHMQNARMDTQAKLLTTVTHILHPLQHDLVLSAATDGSLHAWQFNDCTDK
ncbi:WD repeat-containing protein 73-like [Mizuhopecten yessoensis]|uniref:WD repeat-containing protein 73 n=1 Tax=Mizuhopecten yessoensis TaxID=6573 RepID=A0A210PS04_MIZYE|nr:WD repeat-containing protein 73-like [Mizuhopecten yessoensis]OWF39270.1 WD repeat-containing protein 73 [Mizuhopecten yessoensis]